MACRCDPPTIGEWGPFAGFQVGVWPSQVDAEKRRLDPMFRATDQTAAACAGLAPGARAAWAAFYGEWRAFADEPTGIFGAGGAWDQAKRYERDLVEWQKTIAAASCGAVPGATPRLEQPSDVSVVKWIAGGAIAIAVVYGLVTLAPLIPRRVQSASKGA